MTGIIWQQRCESPYYGESMLMGHLRSMGIFVTRNRVRSTSQRVDPLNASIRWVAGITTRRPYSVPGPNSLWHVGMCSLISTQVNFV